LQIAKERIIVPEPLRPLEVKGIRIEPIHAIHGNQDFTVLTREPDFVDSIAQNCGYIFNINGKRFLEDVRFSVETSDGLHRDHATLA